MGASIPYIFILLAFAFIGVLIPALIGVYVYKDAKSRGMDAALWTIVAILVPSFIGLIIYLVVRSNSASRRCPSCEQPVAAQYALCPYCGRALKGACPSCDTPVDPAWKRCPQCGAELTREADNTVRYAPPKKDRSLAFIIAAVIIIPILLLTLGITAFVNTGAFGTQSSGSVTEGYHIDASQETHAADLQRWMTQCDARGEGVYVLMLSREKISEMKLSADALPQDAYAVYIYINAYQDNPGLMGNSAINGRTLKVSYQKVDIAKDKIPVGYELSYICTTGYPIDVLQIWMDGQQVEYTLEELS